jgi:hypothetical protein
MIATVKQANSFVQSPADLPFFSGLCDADHGGIPGTRGVPNANHRKRCRKSTYNSAVPLDVVNLLSPDGAIARRLSEFESRPQQVEMAAAVERALDQQGRLIVEAGTGVGKSFAYLIPAIKRIVEHKERVIVSTHTINLQEQLIEKDIPLLNAVIPDEFSAVLVKGRGNYLSLRRLKLAREKQDRLFADDDARTGGADSPSRPSKSRPRASPIPRAGK